LRTRGKTKTKIQLTCDLCRLSDLPYQWYWFERSTGKERLAESTDQIASVVTGAQKKPLHWRSSVYSAFEKGDRGDSCKTTDIDTM
jgi:hypothetical protein